MKHDFIVGQTLYLSEFNLRRGHYTYPLKIAKIGRKWLEMDDVTKTRVDIQTLAIDGGNYSSPGKAYLSKEAYVEEHETSRLWADLKDRVARGKCPDLDTVQRITHLLELADRIK